MTPSSRSVTGEERPRVTPVRYTPPTGYTLDVELVTAEDLRDRIARVENRGMERVDFHCLLHVTHGPYEHMVDFETIECVPGSCVIIKPGQVHRFGRQNRWKGWLLIFRSELLQPEHAATPIGDLELFRQVEALPTHVQTTGAVRRAVTRGLEQMAEDATAEIDRHLVNALLRSQFLVMLMRLHLAHAGSEPDERFEPIVLQRFREYRTTVEREFRHWHKVGQYASHLGCSPKTLNRVTLAVTDTSAKAFLVDRIVLEARRLLAHTVLSVSAISDHLGFDEPTNFVKFFRRETGSTPGAFRTEQAASGGASG